MKNLFLHASRGMGVIAFVQHLVAELGHTMHRIDCSHTDEFPTDIPKSDVLLFLDVDQLDDESRKKLFSLMEERKDNMFIFTAYAQVHADIPFFNLLMA